MTQLPTDLHIAVIGLGYVTMPTPIDGHNRSDLRPLLSASDTTAISFSPHDLREISPG